MAKGLIIATKDGKSQSNKPYCAYLKKPKEKPIILYKHETPSCTLERNLAIIALKTLLCICRSDIYVYKVRCPETK